MKSRLMFLFFFIYHSLWSMPNFLLNIHFIKLIKPLEITIGRQYLIIEEEKQNQKRNRSIEIANFIFYNNQTYETPFNILNHHYLQSLHFYSFFYNHKDTFFSLELIPYFETYNIPWMLKNKELNLRSSFFYGFRLDKKDTISTFVGILNEQKIQNQILYENEPIVEYGKIFFIPGIQLRSHSAVLKTFLEVPLSEYNFVKNTSKFYSSSLKDSKANFQIQIRN